MNDIHASAICDYDRFFQREGDMVCCESPTPERETFTQTSYNARTLREKGGLDNFIKSLKAMVVANLISPTFSEIIIYSIKKHKETL